MSYARWSSSAWYAFHCASDSRTRDGQELALWLAHDGGCPQWTYADLHRAGPAWVRKHYPRASRADVREALAIIRAFRADVNYAFRKGRQT